MGKLNYLTAKINQLLAKVDALGTNSIAPQSAVSAVETSPATSAHSAGDLFVYNGTLYRAATAIAIGDTLTVGTNIVATTLASEVEGKQVELSGNAAQYVGFDANGGAAAVTPDAAPTQGSAKLVTSGGAADAILALYPSDTISDAAIASFPDGADGIPVKALTIGIDPVQDLHGYDSPWPSGGGVNQWDEVWESGEIYSNTGNASPNPNSQYWYSVNYTPVDPSKTYYIAGEASNGTSIRARFYDVDKTYLGTTSGSGNTTVGSTFTPPANAAYIRFAPQKTNFPNHRVAINYPSTATAYSPYSNICPISGHTGANVTRTGKNLLDPEERTVGSTNIRYYRNKRLALSAGTYTVSISENVNGLYVNDPTGTIFTKYNSTFLEFTLTEETPVDFNFYSADGIDPDLQCQLELGSTATAYEPYYGTTVIIDLDGTRYGGTLDVTTGVLTVTYKMLTENGDADWIMTNEGTYYAINTGSTDIDYDSAGAQDGFCNYTPFYRSSSVAFDHIWVRPVNGGMFSLQGPGIGAAFPNVESLKAALSQTPLQVVYPLATPQVIQLTHTEVTTLLGQNNLWADTGNVNSLTYRADVELYIAKKLAEA